MKKISFFVAIAAAASLASCTAQAPKANMKNDVDSLSYMMGITNTQGLDMYMSQQLGVDTAYMSDFIRGVKEGTSKTSPKDVALQTPSLHKRKQPETARLKNTVMTILRWNPN